MGGCSAPDCHNSTTKGCRLFGFPKDDVRKRLWSVNCRRGHSWYPTTNSRLCEAHFEDSQFESRRADGWRKLKPNAVPTIFDGSNPPRLLASNPQILKRVPEDNDGPRAKIPGGEHAYAKLEGAKTDPLRLLASNPQILKHVPEDNDSPRAKVSRGGHDYAKLEGAKTGVSCRQRNIPSKTTKETKSSLTINEEDTLSIACDIEVSTVQISPADHLQLCEKLKQVEAKNKQLKNQVKTLKRHLQLSERKKFMLEKNLNKLFNHDQVQELQRVTRGGVRWSKETVQRSLQLMSACGQTGYQVLRDLGHPIPAPRTLRKATEVMRFNGGISNEATEVMQFNGGISNEATEVMRFNGGISNEATEVMRFNKGISQEVLELLQLKVAQMKNDKEKLWCLT